MRNRFYSFSLVLGLLFAGSATLPFASAFAQQQDEKDPRQYSSGSITEDALIGGAAGAILGGLTGGVSAGGVLGGAAAGVGVGNVTAPQTVVLRPNQALNLTLSAPLRW